MQAIWNDKVIAEADEDKIIWIEGNHYFPPDSIIKDYFKPSDKRTTCFWKGQASYFDIEVNGKKFEDGAWYYPDPMPGSIKTVKKDYGDYVSFWSDVKINKS